MMNGFFGNCLVFWRPLNIVSGDFYWAVQVGNYKFLAVADCTGHGVPGAFMSMLGITLLNDIVMHENVAKLTAARVLDQLRAKLKEALRQTGRPGEAADGIDLAFCIFNAKSMQMQYAGAFRPLIIIRNGEIVEYKADKMPCGVYINESPHFTNNIVDLHSGDVLYMYSDGIADQFSGGPELRKFTIRRMKEMLVEVHQKPFDQQKLLIAKTIDDWLTEPDPSYHGLAYSKAFGKGAYITKATAQLMRDLGSIQSPQNAFLLNLGLETLHVRVPRHCANAQAVAEYLEKNPKVAWVNYSGLKSQFKQDFVMDCPVSLLMVIDFEKFGSQDSHAQMMGCVDAGIVSENINLYCQSVGLATVPRATHDTEGLKALLGLGDKQLPILNNPVGFEKK